MLVERLIGFLRKWWWLLGGTILLLVVFAVVSAYGSLDVEITNAKSGEATLQLTNQKSGGFEEVVVSDGRWSKTLKKSDYEILAKQDDASAFAVTKTKGLFGKTTIKLTLTALSGRQYVGNEPVSCMHYLNNTLYSHGCSSTSSARVHSPAGTNQPTYNQDKDLGIGTISGIVPTKEGLVALSQFADEEEGESAQYRFYLLDGQMNPVKNIEANSLKSETSYTIKPFKDGFVVYDSAFENVYYFSNLSAKPEAINQEDADQKPSQMDTYGGQALFVYTGGQESKTAGSINKLVLSDGKTISVFPLKLSASSASLCGKNLICVLENKSKGDSDEEDSLLTVYNAIDGLDALYSISGVNNFKEVGKRLAVIRGDEVLSIDPANGTGYVAYRSSEHSICGVQADGDNPLVCITGGNGRSSVLRLDNSKKNDDIDQKISSLYQLGEINTVSVYKNIIFISPNYGNLIYVDSVGEYDYEPAVKTANTAVINKEIDKLELRKNYQVIINGAP